MDDYLDGYPNTGVYLSDNLNLYAYTWQNPVKYTDPNGKAFTIPTFFRPFFRGMLEIGPKVGRYGGSFTKENKN